MASSRDKPKLSLLATFDDHTRLLQAFADSMDDNFNGPIALFQDYENSRKRWLSSNRMLADRDQQIEALQQENQVLKLKLDSVRLAYTRELKAKDQLQKDFNELRNKLTMVQDLLNEERAGISRPTSQQSVLSVLSDINLLPSSGKFAIKSKYDEHNESDDGLLFDKSDDQLEYMDTDDHRTEVKMPRLEPIYAQVDFGKKASRSTLVLQASDNTYGKSTTNLNIRKQHSAIAEEDEEGDENMHNVGFISKENVLSSPGDTDSGKASIYSTPFSSKSVVNVHHQTDQQPLDPLAKSVSMAAVTRRKSSKLMTKFNLMRQAVKHEPERLDSREHTFQQKKAFKPAICDPCGKSVGFCANYLVCVDCRGAVHLRCQDQLPKPCIPYVVTGAGLKKMLNSGTSGFFSSNHMVMISDFTTHNARPCVPAILVHCCNELDRRIELALNDPDVIAKGADASPVVGLYRLCGSETEIKELRARILDGKSGMPNLANVNDPNVICGVIKSFLRDLDDPLVTKILWNDFVRAAEHVEDFAAKDEGLTDSDYESRPGTQIENDEWYNSVNVLKGVIIQLPNANRDSMAFIFLHLHKVINNQAITKMDSRALSKIFGPTIVGSLAQRFGTIKPSGDKMQSMSRAVINENIKQIVVMQALFRLSDKFWSGLLKDPNFCPFDSENRRRSLNSSLIQRVSRTNLRDIIQDSKKDDPLY